MREVQLKDAKATLSAVVDQAARGEPSIITRHGKPEAVGLNGFAVGRRPSPCGMIEGICSRAGKVSRLDGSNKG
jgi:hypothetical protein